MEALLRIGLVVALCLAGGAAFGQEPISKKAEPVGPRKTEQTKQPAGKAKVAPAKTSVKTIRPAATNTQPAKKVDFIRDEEM